MILTQKQQNIIQALGRYKYLTTSQIIRLGIDKHRSNLSTAFKRLMEGNRPLVKKLAFGLVPTKGRVEALYYLTKHGAQLVKDAKYPIGRTVTLTTDYFHRVATIDCEIALYSSPKIKEVLFSHRYFDHTGSNRTNDRLVSTTLPVKGGKQILADWVFQIQTPKQQELYCAEIYMDETDTSRPFNSLKSYLQALHEGTPNEVFNFERGTRVLAVFKRNSIMEQVITKLLADDEFIHFQDYFLFKSVENLQLCNFDEGWVGYTGEVKQMW